MTDAEHPYVSRGGLKLDAALDAFQLDVRDFTCADLGCNVGGFTDCLLQRGARHVYAVDTGYGALAWKLRQDGRVTVMERTNALHAEPPVDRLDLVVIDLGWTRQAHAIPAALRWRPRHIITLIKPHYEADTPRDPHTPGPTRSRKPILDDDDAQRVADRVTHQLTAREDVTVTALIRSPIRGGKAKRHTGNTEYLAHLQTNHTPPP